MTVPHRSLSPAVFPSLIEALLPANGAYDEFPWMAAFGWYELSHHELPGWQVICQTIEEVKEALVRADKTRIYRLIRRAPQSYAFRVIGRWDVALGPVSGEMALIRLDKEPRTR